MEASYMFRKKFLAVFIACTALVMPFERISPEEKGFRPNFRNTDIEDFIKSMSAIIGKNILLDDRIKGKITIISPAYIPPKLAYPYLSAVLAMKGFGIVDNGYLLKIVPIKDAIAESQTVLLGRDPVDVDVIEKNAVITHMVPTYSSKPSRLAGILKRITDPNTDLVDFDETNMLIITGNAPEVSRLVKILAELDPESNSRSASPESFGNIHIYPLQNMAADKLEATLRKISMPPEAATEAPKPGMPNIPIPNMPQQRVGGMPSKIDIVAHKETNSMIFVGSDSEFGVVKKLIESLDQPRNQVLLELLIVEVESDKTNDFGIDWKVNGSEFGGQLNTGVLGGSGLYDAKSQTLSNPASAINTLSGFSLGFLIPKNGATSPNISSLVTANMGKSNFVILSAP
ncbi:MAG: type II secretion system protein GspD, partial [Spirochaetia bacterium]|nr:type II secretion system protein GspD [Spirochaetia bacterium]